MRMLKVDANFMIESLRLRTESLIDIIQHEMARVEQDEAEAQQVQIDQAQYVNNLESLVRELTSENATLASAANTSPIPLPKKRGPKAKPAAPWGFKKDGTPKKRPGRARGDF